MAQLFNKDKQLWVGLNTEELSWRATLGETGKVGFLMGVFLSVTRLVTHSFIHPSDLR